MSEFSGAGTKEGIEVWRIENLLPVRQPGFTSSFFIGDSYIVLATKAKGNKLTYSAHFWLGAETSQDESGIAAYKTVELDNGCLRGLATHYRELQGSESALFLSYFKSMGGIEYCPGGIASGFRKVETGVYTTRLLHVKGRRACKVSEVEVQLSSLNKGDVFILDKGLSIFVFCGPNANKFEKSKGVEVAKRIDDNERQGKASVFFMDEDPQNVEFWGEFGGFVDPNTLPEGAEDVDDHSNTKLPPTLYRLCDGVVTEVAQGKANMKKSLLDSGDVFYLIDAPREKAFIWVGEGASVLEKREAMPRTLESMKAFGLSPTIQVERMAEKRESANFKSEFSVWPDEPPTKEESSVDVKATIAYRAKIEETSVDDGSGKVHVWVIRNMAKVEVPVEQYGHFFAGDSYIIQYTYLKNGRDKYVLYFWQGRDSSADERGASALLTRDIDDSLGGAALQVRVVQGKEPSHFRQLFKGRMVIHQGGYKKATTTSAAEDTTDKDGIALFQVRGTNALNAVAIQVAETASSLNSCDNFVLVTPTDAFSWSGKFSNPAEREAALAYAHVLAGSYHGYSGRNVQEVQEESEPAEFWDFIGGKGEYSHVYRAANVPEPRLFEASNKSGRFRVDEIPSFDQTDLNDEDLFLLDTGTQLFVWNGSSTNKDEKAKAEEFGKNYVIEVGGDPDECLCLISSGDEPPMFTQYFVNWDPNYFQNAAYKDPYEAKMAAMKTKKGDTSPRIPALKPVPAGGKAVPIIQPMALPSKIAASGGSGNETVSAAISEPVSVSGTFSYADLKAGVPSGVDPARKEEYLSTAEFQQVIGMEKAAFLALPKWKRDTKKKEVGLF